MAGLVSMAGLVWMDCRERALSVVLCRSPSQVKFTTLLSREVGSNGRRIAAHAAPELPTYLPPARRPPAAELPTHLAVTPE